METLDQHILKVSDLTVELPNQMVLENVSFTLAGILLVDFFSYLSNPPPPGPLIVIAGVTIFAMTVLIRWKKRISV